MSLTCQFLLAILTLFVVMLFIVAANHALAQGSPSTSPRQIANPEIDPREGVRDGLLLRARQLRADGHYADAIAARKKALAVELDWRGEAAMDVSLSLLFLAGTAEQGELYTEAIDYHEKSYLWCQTNFGQDHQNTMDARASLARCRLISQLTPDQRMELKTSRVLRSELQKLLDKHELAKAKELATKIADLRSRLLGTENLMYTQSLNDLADVYGNLGDYAAVKLQYIEIVSINRKLLGEQHPGYIESMDNLGRLYCLMGDGAGAEPIMTDVSRLSKQVLGEDDPLYIRRLERLAELYRSNSKLAQSELSFLEALEIQRRVFGTQSHDYTRLLNNLATIYILKREFSRAEPLFVESTQLCKQLLGDQHPDYAVCLTNLAVLYKSLYDFSRAEPLFVKVLEIQKQTLGDQDVIYAGSLSNLGDLYSESGDYARAEPLYQQAMQIRSKSLGERHADFAYSLQQMAGLLYKKCEYSRAEVLFQQSLDITKEVFGELHPKYAASLNNLSVVHKELGNLAFAERLCRKAMQIQKQSLGEHHEDYAMSLHNLAEIYRCINDLGRAELLYQQCLQIQKQVLGENHHDYARTLNILALLYNCNGELEKALPIYLQALDIRKQLFGEHHSAYVSTLNGVALLYSSLGRFEHAEWAYERAMQVQKELHQEHSHNYSMSLNNLAGLYADKGEFLRAENLYLENLKTFEESIGEKHLDYATSLHNLASLYHRMNDHQRAAPLYNKSQVLTQSQFNSTAIVLSEQQQLAMYQAARFQLDDYIGCSLSMNPQPQGAIEQIVALKGAVLYRQRGMRLTAADPSIAAQFKQLRALTQQIYSLVRSVPTQENLDDWKHQLAITTSEREVLESQLMQESDAFREVSKRITFVDVCQAIPEDSLLIDYLQYVGEKGKSLVASVIQRGGPPVMVDLGSTKELGTTIDKWRTSFGMSAEGKAAGASLRKQLWEPLLPYLHGARTILVSTDGELGRMPLVALPGANPGTYLIEEHRIAMIPVPIMLPSIVAQSVDEQQFQRMLVMGDVDYGSAVADELPETVELAAPPTLLLANRARGDLTWPRLAETGREADFIGELFKRTHQNASDSVVVLRTQAATESAFRAAAPSCQLLHLATHGFFDPPDKQNALSSTAAAESQARLQQSGMHGEQRDVVVGFSPGQLSGLVFAGANRPPQPVDPLSNQAETDDGIMTADEIAFSPLTGVQLAVLSACETGLGESAGGEGLLGLQRSLQIAGVRTSAATLWKINDPATRRIMEEFCTNLLEKKMSRLDAMRETQLWALDHPDQVPRSSAPGRGVVREVNEAATATSKRLSPEYWAPFVLLGDWR